MALPLEQRATHLWGSVDAPNMETGVPMVLDIVGEHLALGMSDCETGDRQDWIVGNLHKARDVPGIVVVRDGDLRGYDDFPEHRTEGRVDSGAIQLGYHSHAQAAAPFVRENLRRIGREDAGLLVGIPGGRQLPTFLFGTMQPSRLARGLWPDWLSAFPDIPRGAVFPRYYRPYEQATYRELARILNDPQLYSFAIPQLEHPAETIATLQMARVSPRLGRIAAHVFAKNIVAPVKHMPQDILIGVHLCLGRYQGEAFAAPDPNQPSALEPLVDLANEVVDQWPSGHRPPAIIGIPVTAEGTGTSDNPRYLDPLGGLAVHAETRIGLGIITPQSSLENLKQATLAADRRTGRQVLPTAPCGLASLRPEISGDPSTTERVLRTHADLVRELR